MLGVYVSIIVFIAFSVLWFPCFHFSASVKKSLMALFNVCCEHIIDATH